MSSDWPSTSGSHHFSVQTFGFLFSGPVMLALLGKGSCPAGEEISEEGSGRGSERDTEII